MQRNDNVEKTLIRDILYAIDDDDNYDDGVDRILMAVPPKHMARDLMRKNGMVDTMNAALAPFFCGGIGLAGRTPLEVALQTLLRAKIPLFHEDRKRDSPAYQHTISLPSLGGTMERGLPIVLECIRVLGPVPPITGDNTPLVVAVYQLNAVPLGAFRPEMIPAVGILMIPEISSTRDATLPWPKCYLRQRAEKAPVTAFGYIVSESDWRNSRTTKNVTDVSFNVLTIAWLDPYAHLARPSQDDSLFYMHQITS